MRCESAWRGVRSLVGLPPMRELAGVGAVDAAEQAGELGAPGAEQAGEADDLALVRS